MKPLQLVISCEHAVNSIPDDYLHLFGPYKALLNTHRGMDFGSLEIAEHLQQITGAPLFAATTSRLLIDCNRSLNHHTCFSEITRPLPQEEKERIINLFYTPYRNSVTTQVKNLIQQGQPVLHLSIHSFTPILNDMARNADFSYLYDPQRPSEQKFAKLWKESIHSLDSKFKIRMNYPYKGTSDALTTTLRKQLPPTLYLGLELETNQKLVENTQSLGKLKNIVADSLLLITS